MGTDGLTPQPHDQGGYFDLSTDRGVEVRKEMSKALAAFGIRVEASHHEVAPGNTRSIFATPTPCAPPTTSSPSS